MPTISVLIPAYNEEKYIAECLRHILKYKTENVTEVIVIDNASTDATASVASSFAGVKVLREDKKGLTAARQCGLNGSTGDLLAFVDADTLVPENWFKQIDKAFSNDSRLVCLSGPYDYYDLPNWQRFCVKAYWNILAYPAYLMIGYMVVGGNFVASRKALLAINGFDTKIAFYGEDADIGRRLHSQGRMQFSTHFYVPTSGRRIAAQGLLRMAFVYLGNFLSDAFFHKPMTQSYTDIR